MSRTYVTAVEKLPGMRIVGAVSRSGRKPENWPPNKPLEVSDSLRGIRGDFDAVILTTPNGMHSGLAQSKGNGRAELRLRYPKPAVPGGRPPSESCLLSSLRVQARRVEPESGSRRTQATAKRQARSGNDGDSGSATPGALFAARHHSGS